MLLDTDYDRHDALGLAARVASGEMAAAELLELALARTEALNPALNAVTLLQPASAHAQIRRGLPVGPLSGVPFLLKDLGAEARAFPSHSGSALLANTVHSKDSTMHERLAAAGLVTFGRTTAPEGGIGPVTEAAVYGGPTRNPWNLEHTPGGSSGGAGAAVAAGIVPAAHGSDGGGSVRIPASSCGLFGYKATRARLPDGPDAGEGWAGMAIDGFLTRSVRDGAALLDAVQGPDSGAPYRAPPLQHSFLAATTRAAPRLRIAVTTTTLDGKPIHPECRYAVEHTARLLDAAGHHVQMATPRVNMDDMNAAWTTIVACGTALWVNQTLAARGMTLAQADIETVARGACEHAATLRGEDYLDAINRIHAFGRDLAAFFHTHDLLLTATLAEPPARIGRFAHDNPDFLDYRLGDHGVFAYSPFTAAFNASGQPAASLPMHWTPENLPVGVQLAAAFGEDETLMSICSELEALQPWFQRRPPRTVRA